MNAPLDEITTFLGAIPPEEYEQRRRLRTLRNAASYKATQTGSADARALCWMVTERANEWIYAPADTAALTAIVELCRNLLTLADQIGAIEATLYE